MLIPLGRLVLALLVTLEGIYNGILLFAPQVQNELNQITNVLTK